MIDDGDDNQHNDDSTSISCSNPHEAQLHNSTIQLLTLCVTHLPPESSERVDELGGPKGHTNITGFTF